MNGDPKPTMKQEAPFPVALYEIVNELTYKPGFEFWLGDMERDPGCSGLTFVVRAETPDSYDKDHTPRAAMHYFPVPPATYDRRAWIRWVFDRILDIETHECMEFFKVRGDRPFSPNHGPGRNPYSIIEKGTFKDARTMFTGRENPPGEAEKES